MTVAVIVLALVSLLETAGLIYFARAALLNAQASGADRATAAVAAEEIREDNANVHQLDVARKASEHRAAELEKEASHASAVAPGDGLARLRELDAPVAGDAAPADPGPAAGDRRDGP